MKKRIYSVCFFLVAVLFSLNSNAQNYIFDKKIDLPGDGSYDYLAIDEMNNHLFVSHGTTFHVIDLTTDKLITTIDAMQGVHGIAIVNDVNKGFISDGMGQSVRVIDLSTFKIIKTIALPYPDADAIIYDPYSKKVLVFNGDSKNTCVIDVNTLKLVKSIDLGGNPEFAVSDGKGLVFNNIENLNCLKVIDTKTFKVKSTYPLSPCGGPTGIALDMINQRIFTGCRTNKGLSVVDALNGKVVTTIPIGMGVDAVVYDPQTKLIFVSNADATLTIIKQLSADRYKIIQTLVTQLRAKTMALDSKTKRIYTSAPIFEKGTNKKLPNTFAVYVYKPE